MTPTCPIVVAFPRDNLMLPPGGEQLRGDLTECERGFWIPKYSRAALPIRWPQHACGSLNLITIK